MHERLLGDAVLGLAYGKVRLVDGDPGWPGAFERLSDALRLALGSRVSQIEHVGSTAVPGLTSKPILDVAIGLTVTTDPTQVIMILEPLGWIYRGDKGDAGLLLVLEDRPAHRVAHAHVVRYRDTRWRQYLAFRERLRRDPVARDAYAELKLHLAQRFADDRRAYTAAKDDFITELLARD
jgi:GrpB-like predicted nucleotidyltransferase (UPF0157 family)